jgi:hypothetical protein
MLRTCTKCARELPATTEYFHRAITIIKGKRYDGLRGDCRDCFKAKINAYYHGSEEVKRRFYEYGKRRKARPEVREENRIYAREKKRKDRSTEEGAAKLRDYVRAWRASHPDNYARYKAYKGLTPQIVRKNAIQHARKLKATPPWVDLEAIVAFYMIAKGMTEATGIRYSVDHIMPLKGKTSSGLNVPWNLQVIPLLDNIKKGNRHS